MAFVVTLIGVLITIAGIVIAIEPRRIIRVISSLESRTRFWSAIVVRIALGLVFLGAAPGCRWPVAVQLVGFLSLAAAAGLFLLGRSRMDGLLDWWAGRSPSFLRSWSIFAIAFGALLIYAGPTTWFE